MKRLIHFFVYCTMFVFIFTDCQSILSIVSDDIIGTIDCMVISTIDHPYSSVFYITPLYCILYQRSLLVGRLYSSAFPAILYLRSLFLSVCIPPCFPPFYTYLRSLFSIPWGLYYSAFPAFLVPQARQNGCSGFTLLW